MLKIELRAAPNGIPGQGELRLQGWKQSLDGLELAVQRNQDGYYLDATSLWSASQRWTALTDVSDANGVLQATVGPWLVDPLTADPSMTYMFYLRNADGNDKGVLRIIGELLSSAAVGSSPAPIGSFVAPAVTPQPAPEPEPESVPEPESEPESDAESESESESAESEPPAEPPKKTLRWLLVVLLLVLVLAAAGAAWWWLLRDDKATDPAASNPSADTSDPGSPCHPQALTGKLDDLALLQACVKSQPTSAQTLELIRAAENAKRCNLAQRLFAYKAQAGDTEVALAYARRYDPEGFTAGACIDKADGETAAYWYERVLEQQPDNAHAKQRLEALQP